MTVILNQYKLFYAAIPKIACISLKTMFFEIENDFKFTPYSVNGNRRHIHNMYPSMLPQQWPEQRIRDFYRMTLVRDPIKRFLSAYGNRVIFHKELSENACGPKLEALGLEPTPDLDLFVDRYEDYLKAHNSIFHHTRPMVDFIGHDPSYFSRIYNLSEMDQLLSDISDRVGRSITVGHKQTGGPKFKPDDLTEAQRKKLRKIYAQDYKIYDAYF